MSNTSILIGVLNAVREMFAQTSGEGALMAQEYIHHFQRINKNIRAMSQAQIDQEFAHSDFNDLTKGISHEKLLDLMYKQDPSISELTRSLGESTEDLFKEENDLVKYVITSEYFCSEPPFIDYIESYKESKKEFEKYSDQGSVPKVIVFKLLKDKYHLINGVMNRLLTLTKELNTTNRERVPENYIQDNSENALETVVIHYKEQYEYASKRLKEFTNS